ncbi:hypothetical protein BJY28_001794 [Janibacter alkaliphilus]|uniref:Uncharacterized protein n=2 Tax=Janibacter alkaliphilus TaxID=1069963 RepID=A0A852XFL3_9MICO|nr:hypothetical protein [Janibacter alkaliphilus]
MMEFIRRVPDGASLTLESIQRNVLPINAMATAMGLHTCCGNEDEDTLWGKKGEHATSVQQIEQIVRLAGELGREVATAKEARELYQIGTYYDDVDDALRYLGLPPNRLPGQRGFLMHERPVIRTATPATTEGAGSDASADAGTTDAGTPDAGTSTEQAPALA